MKYTKALLAGLPCLVVAAAPAQATQLTQTWVSHSGSDTNACTAAAPCATFAGAYANTAAGGEIDVADAGNYGGLSISHAITIRAVGVLATANTVGAAFATTPSFALNIYIAAGANDKVELDGLTIEQPVGAGAATINTGVFIIGGGDVLIRNCTFRNFQANPQYAGALVAAPPSGSVRFTVENSSFFNNANAITVASASAAGGYTGASTGTSHLKLFNSLLIGNTTNGVAVIGAGNNALLSGNQILGSSTALKLSSGGTAQTYGNNVITNSVGSPVQVPLN